MFENCMPAEVGTVVSTLVIGVCQSACKWRTLRLQQRRLEWCYTAHAGGAELFMRSLCTSHAATLRHSARGEQEPSGILGWRMGNSDAACTDAAVYSTGMLAACS